MENTVGHVPVLRDEAVAALQPVAGGVYVDATFGGGGYTKALLAAADCRVVAIDRDPDAIARATGLALAEPRLTVLDGGFGGLRELLAARAIGEVDGVVFDLGVSSYQLDDPARGFSFRGDGPLDMRMAAAGSTAADLVRETDELQLRRWLAELGEEPQARAIAKAIVKQRAVAPITTTRQLADLVARVKGGRQGRIDPATRTFQALRMAVNDELGELQRGLAAAETLLRPGGRLVTVSFHSGEDAIVKRFVDAGGGRDVRPSRHAPPVASPVRQRWRWVERRVVRPGEREVGENPRARSARLRAAERLADAEEGEGWGWRRAA